MASSAIRLLAALTALNSAQVLAWPTPGSSSAAWSSSAWSSSSPTWSSAASSPSSASSSSSSSSSSSNSSYSCGSNSLQSLGPEYNTPSDGPNAEWNGWGGNVFNNRWNPDAGQYFQSNVSLTETCSTNYTRGVSATPAVLGDTAYYPTYSGLLVALNYKTCKPYWTFNVSQAIINYAPLTKLQEKLVFTGSRTSPVIDGDTLYIGTEKHALLMAVDRISGQHIASTQINPHPLAVATMSPTFFEGLVYIGTSSREEAAALKVANYSCCSFVGNFAAFKLENGSFSTVWNQTMLPLDSAWSGGAVWGSQPSIDPVRRQVFIGTGNVYTYPKSYESCRNSTQALNLTSDPCVPKNVWQETILAFDLNTGLLRWEEQLSPIDAWTAACGFGNSIQHRDKVKAHCPYKPGPDADFGMAPTYVPGSDSTPHGLDTIVVGQKNGNLFAIDAQTGRILWAVNTSPDGNLGGVSFGIAVDADAGLVAYTAMNSDYKSWQLIGGKQINNSAWGAADLRTGKSMWQTAVDMDSFAFSPPTIAGEAIFIAREDTGSTTAAYHKTSGALEVLNKRNGERWGVYPLHANVHGGIAVVNGTVLVGSGYHKPYKGFGGLNVFEVAGQNGSSSGGGQNGGGSGGGKNSNSGGGQNGGGSGGGKNSNSGGGGQSGNSSGGGNSGNSKNGN